MDQNLIAQFVCYVTTLDTENFISFWRPLVKQDKGNHGELILQHTASKETANRFNYVSQHQCNSNDFSYAFMKGRREKHFPEQKARIVQIGGYRPVQVQCSYNDLSDEVKVMAFLNHSETDLDFYHQQTCRHLNIYEAYYENCTYGHVLEFFVQEQDASLLVNQLKTRTGIEVASYKECKFQLAR